MVNRKTDNPLQASKQASKQARIASLQVVRIVACLSVFAVHFGQRVGLTGVLRAVTDLGQYGVHVFLIISGFFAAKGLDNHIEIVEYYKKRFISIMPLYYCLILYYFITENALEIVRPHIPADPTGLGWLRYVFLLNGFVKSDTYFWSNLGITWTIPIFVFFYLVAPFAIRLIRNKTCASLAFIVAVGISFGLRHLYECSVITNLYLPFAGVLLFFFWKDKKQHILIPVFVLLAVLLALLHDRSHMLVSLLAAGIAVALVFSNKLVFREKTQKWIDRLDEHTYTIYLVHGVVFCSLIDRLKPLGVPSVIIGGIAILLTTVGTILVHKWIEKPIQTLLRKELLHHST